MGAIVQARKQLPDPVEAGVVTHYLPDQIMLAPTANLSRSFH